MARVKKSITTKLLEQKLTEWLYRYFSDKKYTITQFSEMLREDPVTGVANASLKLAVASMLGEYTNEDQTMVDAVQENFALFQGSTDGFIQKSLGFMSHGSVLAHIKSAIRDNKAYLDVFTFLPMDRVYFKVDSNQQIEAVRILTVGKEYPYQYFFHLVNEDDLTPGEFDPFGVACCARAIPYWELHKILFAVYSILGKKQTSKLLFGKVPDTDAEVETDRKNDDGTPILSTSGMEMKLALEAVEEASVVVGEIGDEIEAIDQTTDGKFFDSAFNYLATQRFLAFYQPQSVFAGNKSGVGDAGLAESQKETFLNFVEAKAKYLSGQMIEQLIRPIVIEYNYGVQEQYGYFQLNRQDPKALETAALVMQLLGTEGIDLDEQNKENAYNKLKSLLGI